LGEPGSQKEPRADFRPIKSIRVLFFGIILDSSDSGTKGGGASYPFTFQFSSLPSGTWSVIIASWQGAVRRQNLPRGIIACNDDRTMIIQEYYNRGLNNPPVCANFESHANNYAYSNHFEWHELNGEFADGNPHDPFGWITTGLIDGLEATRTSYGAAIYLSSGYRCPDGNASPTINGAVNSLHMRGRAADMYRNANHTWANEAEFNLLKAEADATNPAPTESLGYNTYANHHYHAAW
jgi:hypothetical protein